MGTRVVRLLLLLALVGCSGDDGDQGPAGDRTTDAECARRVPDEVLTTLGWTATGTPAEATVRGCHREAAQGYVEVRDRPGYDRLCATLDRTGGVGPGTPVDWLGDDVTACAVEPEGDGVGETQVVVRRDGDAATVVTVVALTSTPQAQVRAAVAQLAGV